MENWNAESLMALVGMVLSLAFAYMPFAKDWYEKLDARYKPLFMAGVLFVVSVAYVVITCRADWACMQANAGEALSVFFAALFANMATYATAVKQFKSPRATPIVTTAGGGKIAAAYPPEFLDKLYRDTEPTGTITPIDFTPRRPMADSDEDPTGDQARE